MDLTTANYTDVRARRFDVAILPWGATEPHNGHLPYCTDILIPEALSRDAAQVAKDKYGIETIILPSIPLGSQNPGQWDLPFCIHTRYETQRAILGDIVASLHRQGMRTLVIMNGHGGNSFKNMLRDLAFDYPDFRIAVCDWYAIVPQEQFFEVKDDHAGEMETSLMLHYYPELIDMKNAGDGRSNGFSATSLSSKIGWLPRDWSRVSFDTGIGDPRRATADKGSRCAAWLIEEIAKLLEELPAHDLY